MTDGEKAEVTVADDILERHVIYLSGESYDRFLRVVDNPPEPPQKLRDLLSHD